MTAEPAHGALHHVELWVPDLDRAVTSWGWLLPAVVALVVTSAAPAAAHEVTAMPGDNLIANPWLTKVVNGKLQLDTSGWVFEGSPTWGTGNDKNDCPGRTSLNISGARSHENAPTRYVKESRDRPSTFSKWHRIL